MRRTWWPLLAALGLACPALGDEPSKTSPDQPGRKLQVVSPKDDGIIATGLNNRGDVVGFRWMVPKAYPIVTDQVPFFASGKTFTILPALKGYTSTTPAGVSDDGLVVGYVGKFGERGVRVPLRTQAFVWDAKRGMRGLGALKDDWASVACGIARDGRRISGFSVGNDRTRACVWDRAGDDDRWTGTALLHESKKVSQVIAISSDGRRVTAADGQVPCLWTRDDSGTWKREAIGEADSLYPRAVNSAGTVVGLRHTYDGNNHAVVWSRTNGMRTLPEPGGYGQAEALAINDEGVIVGMVTGAVGSKVGPRAFVLEPGADRLRLIDEGRPAFSSATAINDKGQVAGILAKDDEDD